MNGLVLLLLASESVSKLASRFYTHTHTHKDLPLVAFVFSSSNPAKKMPDAM